MSPKQSQFEADRVEEEEKKLGIGVNRALYRELTFDLNNQNPKVLIRGEEVNGNNTLGMWFRVAGTKSGKYTEGRNLAIRLLQKEIFCANHEGYLKWERMGKISQHAVFIENEIPVVATRIYYTKKQIKSPELLRKMGAWEFPVISKHDRGYQGKSVRKFDSWKEEEEWVDRIEEKNLGCFLWQKYLPSRWDIRVIVIAGKAIGAMKRSPQRRDEFRSNYSLGGKVERWELDNTERNLAERVARVCGLDYCGIDMMYRSKSKDQKSKRKGNPYVLEVNRQCQFQGFEKATGINVAKKTVDMFWEKG